MWSVLLCRIRATFQRQRGEREFSEEIESHLALLADDFARRGMSPSDARKAALRSFGGVAQVQDSHREARAILHFDRLLADVRYALRGMGRNPGFAVLAVLTLGLGIGVNTTLFTAFNAIALKPLPIADPGSVYRMERWFRSEARGNVQYAFSWDEYSRVRDGGRSFAGVAAAGSPVRNLAEVQGFAPVRVQVQPVSTNYFDVLGVVPRQGRGFLPDDGLAAASPVVVLSESLARRLPGSFLQLNGTRYTVVGVAPEEFTGSAQDSAAPDAWIPAVTQMRDSETASFQLLGRLRSAVPAGRARAEADLIIRQTSGGPRADDPTVRVTLHHPVFLDNTEDPRFQALVAGMMLLVGTVLLAACANLANLMLARGASRQKEIGVRLALGAARSRLLRQLLTESVLLGLGGGIAGLALALWSSRILWLLAEAALRDHFPGVRLSLNPEPDLRVLAYALGISVVAGVLFGLFPALRCTRPNLITAIKDDAAAFGVRITHSRLRALLVAGQVAVSMTLLITAGLLTRGLSAARTADPGFDTRTLFTLFADYGSEPARQHRVLERLRTIPEIASITEGGAPLMGTWTPPMIAGGIQGRTLATSAGDLYLETIGLPLLRGRTFTRQEVLNSAPVAVISEGAARTFWPEGDPIGHRFQLDMNFRGAMASFEVVGIVKDARLANLSRLDPAHVYVTPRPGKAEVALLRIPGDPHRALDAIRRAVGEVAPDLSSSLVVESIADGPLWMQQAGARIMAAGASILAGLALLLAAAGIYGVMAYLVALRTREIGVRMALGAGAGQVIRDVVIAGLQPVFAGMAVGIAAAAAISAALHTTLRFPGAADFLYGISFYDPVTFVGLSALVLLLTALASAVPARRAVRVDPLTALRCD